MSQVPLSSFTAVENVPYAIVNSDGSVDLFIADVSYVPLLAQTNNPNAVFSWTNANKAFDQNGSSFADTLLDPEKTVTVTVDAKKKVVNLIPVTATPPLIVPGQQTLSVKFHADGHSFGAKDTFTFPDDSGLSVANITVQAGDLVGDVSADGTATTGAATVIFNTTNDKGKAATVATDNSFTVYNGVMWSLVQVLQRPVAGNPQQALPGAAGGNPRTQVQEQNIAAILNTTQAAVRTPWDAWVAADASLTVGRPSQITGAQLSVVLAAAAQIEANSHAVPLNPAPPNVPVSMWKGYITFLANEESGNKVLEMAAVAAESSAGIVQFNDTTATGQNNAFQCGTKAVAIYKPGGIVNWKTELAGNATIAELTAEVQYVGGDWRADVFASLVNAIRYGQGNYGRLIVAPGGAGSYLANKSYRVDLTTMTNPARADGNGNQRDTFQLIACAHRNPGDPFGGGGLPGGLTTAPTPETWTADNAHMTAAGVTRADDAATYWDNNAGGGYT